MNDDKHSKPMRPRLKGDRECIKKKFYSKAGADSAVAYVQANRKKNKSKKCVNIVASYNCPYCGFWHTTSKPQR